MRSIIDYLALKNPSDHPESLVSLDLSNHGMMNFGPLSDRGLGTSLKNHGMGFGPLSDRGPMAVRGNREIPLKNV